jgi:dihydroxyacetone kinase-like protein
MSGKVGLISGGGSGDEPLHGGFVGVGMLDAAGRWPG